MAGGELEGHAAAPEEEEAEAAGRKRLIEGEAESHPVTPERDRPIGIRRAHDEVVDRLHGREATRSRHPGVRDHLHAEAREELGRRPVGRLASLGDEANGAESPVAGLDLHGAGGELEPLHVVRTCERLDAEEQCVGPRCLGDVATESCTLSSPMERSDLVQRSWVPAQRVGRLSATSIAAGTVLERPRPWGWRMGRMEVA